MGHAGVTRWRGSGGWRRSVTYITAWSLAVLTMGQPLAEAVVLSESLDGVKGRTSGSATYDRDTDSLEAVGEKTTDVKNATVLASGAAQTGTLTTTTFTTNLTNATDSF